MPTTFISGDLFAHPGLPALAHGCNCAGAMGKGIATEFRDRYPAMYQEYKARCSDGRFTPGDAFVWHEGELTIFNLGTQKTWRSKATLGAVEKSLATMIRLAEEQGLERVGLPRIGAGLGRLPWQDVRALLERLGAETNLELVVFETYEPRSA